MDLSSSKGKFHISETELLIILCLIIVSATIGNRYEQVLPNTLFVFFLTLRGLAGFFMIKIRIEWGKRQQSLMKPSLFIDDTFHLIEDQINIIFDMINKKLSGLFLRKQTIKKQQTKQNLFFDENFFHCRLVSTGINTQLIRIQTQLKQSGQPLDQIKCKWFIKNSHDFRQIEDVTSQYYQPCLDDVGSIICVQIEPFIEGKKYNGITIMEESQVLKIDQKLEEELGKFLQTKYLKLDGKLQTVFSQNEKYQSFELPVQIKVQIKNSQIFFYTNGKQFEEIRINSEYPNVEFNRKSFNSILLNFNDRESFKLSFANNFNRDLFTLITRTVSAHSVDINPEQINQEIYQPVVVKKQLQCQIQATVISQSEVIVPQKSEQKIQVKQEVQTVTQIEPSTKKCQAVQIKQDCKIEVQEQVQAVLKDKIVEEPRQNNTHLILKLDEQSKQLKLIKRQLDELKLNYNIEKQAKKNIEAQCDQFKKDTVQLKQQLQQAHHMNKKLSQVNEDNRFYKNEIAIIRKELKVAKQRNKQLESNLESKNNQQIKQEAAKQLFIQGQKVDLKNMTEQALKAKEDAEADLERIKTQFQNMQNQNTQLKKKLQSLLKQTAIHQPKQIAEKPKSNQSEQRIIELQMKLKNLQMLLRYKSIQGDSSSNFQILVNKLTQTISEKELQINQFKRINKNLLEQLKEIKNKSH